MRFGIVVPTHNRKETLRQTLTSLTAQDDAEYEIIVVDDGSSDGTREMIAREFPRVHYIAQNHCGPAAARNRGIKESRGEIIAFTDDDCLPPRDWLTRLADGYARYPRVAGVGGHLQAPNVVLENNAFARYERFIARRVYAVSECEYLGGFECPAGGTNNMSYRREILKRVGGFDESFPHAAGEDADLKWRVCQTGAQLLFVPVQVTHLQTYDRQSFARQAYTRGKGKARFDAKYAHTNRSRALARLVRRWLNLPFDALDAAQRDFIAIKFAEAWHNFRGEWAMIAEMKRWTSST